MAYTPFVFAILTALSAACVLALAYAMRPTILPMADLSAVERRATQGDD